MVVADTAFLIDILVGDAKALAKLDGFLDREVPLWIPAPALHELHYGARRHRHADRERRRVEELEQAMPSMPLDAPAARLAGTLEAELGMAGRPPSRMDIQIAAIALLRSEPVVTRDKKFPAPRGLALERY